MQKVEVSITEFVVNVVGRNNRKRQNGEQIRIRHRFRQYTGKWFDYLFVLKEEMKEILKETGWKINKFIEYNNSQYIALIEKNKP